ncbi:sporulation protein YqfC [Marinicrinis lubricantis]|uniref:Sporulation protein YqfC n=1 Tax=Marinicrinis lubricantis TaxID=2086470 RepID=A0ABW1IUS0_9BACL
MLGLNRKLKKWTANVLDLPKDVVFDLPRITMIGNMQLYIENHRGVLHFSPEQLQLKLSTGTMEIKGTGLVIRAILTEEVFIEGTIDDIRYVQA